MAIADKLRKAASLFVVMDEKPQRQQAPRAAAAAAAAAAKPGAAPGDAGAGAGTDELDRRLAQMNATIRQLNTGMADAATAASGTAGSASPRAGGGGGPADGGGARTIDDLLRETEGPSLGEIAVPASGVPAPDAGGDVDFAAIYRAANLPGAPFTAEQTLEMLNSLPANLPLEMKRQTVSVTIAAMGKSIGTSPESIVADASRKLAALASYEENFTKQTDEFVAAAEFEIDALLQQVEEKRKAIVEARQRQADVVQKVEGEGDRLDDILEFFSLDIGPSRYAAEANAGTAADAAAKPPPLPPAGPA